MRRARYRASGRVAGTATWHPERVSVRAPWRRIAAWAVDCVCILGWVAITVAVGVPLYLAGVTRISNLLVLNVVGALVVVVPVVIGLAALEHVRGATVGKQLLGLRVEANGQRPSWGRALLRNSLKVGVPWLIGHAAVFAVATDPSPATSVLLIAAYVLPVTYLISLFAGGGRTPYDRLGGVIVVRADRAPA